MKANNSIRVLAAAALAAICVLPGRAEADNAAIVTYDSVDSYRMGEPGAMVHIAITGVVHGASAPTTAEYYSNTGTDVMPACERQVIIAINRPGRFSLTIETMPGAPTNIRYCTLTRLP